MKNDDTKTSDIVRRRKIIYGKSLLEISKRII